MSVTPVTLNSRPVMVGLGNSIRGADAWTRRTTAWLPQMKAPDVRHALRKMAGGLRPTPARPRKAAVTQAAGDEGISQHFEAPHRDRSGRSGCPAHSLVGDNANCCGSPYAMGAFTHAAIRSHADRDESVASATRISYARILYDGV